MATSTALSRYDVATDLRAFEELAKGFGRDFLAGRRNAGSSDLRPIFILGLPRSGTSLVEQILAAHPEVAAGGEMPFLREAAGQVVETPAGKG